jgi:FtsX-like permease family
VIPLSLRLALRGGRETVIRLAIIVAAVGLGTGLLLAAISGINAVNEQNDATAWLWTGNYHEPAGPANAGIAPLWWRIGGDTFHGQAIARVDLAATGASSPVPPGIPHDPGPGQYYASPALATLLRSTPADELADRYPGHLIGTIGHAALQSPDSLVIIIGHAPAQLAGTPATVRVTAIAPALPGGFGDIQNPKGLSTGPPTALLEPSGVDLVLSVAALAILIPALIFIGTATRLSAARREQRFAAMRLVGATRRQVSLIAAVESTVAAIGGVAVGFALFFLLRIPLAAIPFTGQPFFPAQMSLSVADVAAAAFGIPAAAAVAARLALRRVQISPLGVARRVTPSPPKAWRLVPLLAGVAELGFFAVHGRPASNSGQVQAFFPGFLLVVIGLIIAGPWLTMAGARFTARRARHPGALIAARRLADDPRAGFRAVSGLVLALFVTTVAVGLNATEQAKMAGPYTATVTANVLIDQVNQEGPVVVQVHPRDQGGPSSQQFAPAPPSLLSAALTARLRRSDGVTGIVEVRDDPALTNRFSATLGPAGLVSCAQLAAVPGLGRCPAGAAVAALPFSPYIPRQSLQEVTWPAVRIAPGRLTTSGLDAVDLATNGSRPAIERARTLLENAYPVLNGPQTLGESQAADNTLDNAYQQLAEVVIVTSLAIAGCTLAASIAGGLADRKRPFSMLRLTGARLATLRRVVVLESAVPLIAVAIVGIGTGWIASALYSSAEMQHPLASPGTGYYVFTVAGILASLAIIAATFPLLRRITGPEVARNE